MGNTCGSQSVSNDEYNLSGKQESGPIDKESFKLLQYFKQKYNFQKYQYSLGQNLSNVKKVLEQNVYGGGILSLSTPINERLSAKKIDTVNNGGYYVLQNVQKQENEAVFVDIWIVIHSIQDKEILKKIKSLNDHCKLNMSFWKKGMVYPYERKFILFDEIASELTGIGRFIEYRCFKLDEEGLADPTEDLSGKHNWITNIYEGEFKNGKADGFQRSIEAFNGHIQYGYYQNGKVFGKWIDVKGLEFNPATYPLGINHQYGVYDDNTCVELLDLVQYEPGQNFFTLTPPKYNGFDFLINKKPETKNLPDENKIFEEQYKQDGKYVLDKDRYYKSVKGKDPSLTGYDKSMINAKSQINAGSIINKGAGSIINKAAPKKEEQTSKPNEQKQS